MVEGSNVFGSSGPCSSALVEVLATFITISLGEEDETTLGEVVEGQKRLEERWKLISDTPPVGPDGAEEYDRQLIGNYDTA
jgi:hypothetical protein